VKQKHERLDVCSITGQFYNLSTRCVDIGIMTVQW